MSELIQKNDSRATIRWKLLTGVSALALTAYVSSGDAVHAEDVSRPTIWVELGGQAEAVSGEGQPFDAPFLTTYSSSPAFSGAAPFEIQKPPSYSFGGEASISFQPEDSNWIFSAGIRYGRSSNHRQTHHQTTGHPVPATSYIYQYLLAVYGSHFTKIPDDPDYGEFKARHSESHAVIDFQAGKDVGLGMFGRDSTSVLSGGLRVARFSSSATVDIRARPDVKVDFITFFPKYYLTWHNFHLSGQSERSFHGIGPSLAWNSSIPLAGNLNDGELAFDWSINGSVLFGKQTAKIHHHTSGDYFDRKYSSRSTSYNKAPPPRTHSRNVTVPNVGGSAAISYKFANAKLSLGYRYDTFLNAMDTGIDTAHKADMTFKGPFASISIGIGD